MMDWIGYLAAAAAADVGHALPNTASESTLKRLGRLLDDGNEGAALSELEQMNPIERSHLMREITARVSELAVLEQAAVRQGQSLSVLSFTENRRF